MIRTVIGMDGRVRQEQTAGSLRRDMSSGETSVVLGRPGSVRTVLSPGRPPHIEHQAGHMRTSIGREPWKGPEQLF